MFVSQVRGRCFGHFFNKQILLQESVEGADSRNNLIKQLSFGKLPECLCFHIQRTGFSGGQVYKRHDYVEFPLELNMERFTHASQAARLRNLHSFMMGADNLSLDNQNKVYNCSCYIIFQLNFRLNINTP